MTGPLHGTRVVSVAGIGALPLAQMMLADLGADVVVVTRPSPGELEVVPVTDDPVLRNQLVVRADLKRPAGLAVVRDLVACADVFLEGFRPGTAERLGLGPDDLLAANPWLIYGRMTGWGQDGPDAGTAGHDLNYLSVTGALHAIGPSDRPPPPPLNLVGDYGGGAMFLVTGVLAALLERARSGAGQVIDAAMVDGVGALLQPLLSWRAAGVWTDRRESNLLDGGLPYYATYACSDGRFVAVAALEKRFYEALLHGLGVRPEDLPDRDARPGRDRLRAVIAERFAQRTRDEWAAVFAGTDACVTPVLTVAEAETHPHLAARGTLHRSGGVLQAAPAPRFSRSSPPAAEPARVVAPAEVLAQWRSGRAQEGGPGSGQPDADSHGSAAADGPELD